MRTIALIPARFASTRFQNKLMQPLGIKTVIRHTYDNVKATRLFADVIVVTDHPDIFNEINLHGGHAMMSINEHESGSDRIAEAAASLDAEIILNVQGDEPFVNKEALAALIKLFENPLEKVEVASLMKKITEERLIQDVNCVKVVVDKEMNSLYFSRNPIPYHRDKSDPRPDYYEHVGVYAFRKEALMQFTKWEMTALEKAEKIECLRYLENGIRLKMAITESASAKIDVPEDLARAEAYLNLIQNL
jgi:3-deoxy-manno-octulosonate cytidylyltransferase (CMP-KDO synthetase)